MDELTARLEAAFKAWAALDGEDRAALVASADAPRAGEALRVVRRAVPHNLGWRQEPYVVALHFDGAEGGAAPERAGLPRWFGVEPYVTLQPLGALAERAVEANEATTLVGAAANVLATVGAPWPVFVPVHDAARDGWVGIACDAHGVTTHFTSDRVQGGVDSAALATPDGQLELLYARIGAAVGEISASGMRPPTVNAAIRLTYRLAARSDDEFEMVEDEQEGSAAAETAVVEPSPLGSWDEGAPWAAWTALVDPWDDVQLETSWPRVNMRQLMEVTKGLHPSSAPDWVVRAVPRLEGAVEASEKSRQHSFAEMLRAVAYAEDAASGASSVAELASDLFWDATAQTLPRPPDSVLDGVIHDIFSAVASEDRVQVQNGFARLLRTAPPTSLLARVALHALLFSNVRAIALLWTRFVNELRLAHWERGVPLPSMPPGELPDLSQCLIQQKLQLLNICIARRGPDPQPTGVPFEDEGWDDDDGGWGDLDIDLNAVGGAEGAADIARTDSWEDGADGWDGDELSELVDPSGLEPATQGEDAGFRIIGPSPVMESFSDRKLDEPDDDGSDSSEYASASEGDEASEADDESHNEVEANVKAEAERKAAEEAAAAAAKAEAERKAAEEAAAAAAKAEAERKAAEAAAASAAEAAANVDAEAEARAAAEAEAETHAEAGPGEREEEFWLKAEVVADWVKPQGVNETLNKRLLNPPHPFMNVPVTQEHPAATEDMLHEREKALAALGDSKLGKDARARLQCDMLISDMSAFKAANPGSCLADFVRWHSPRDWIAEAETDGDDELGGGTSGTLSERMRQPGTLWAELWDECPSQPAAKQQPLLDVTKEGEKILHYLETISPADLLEQLTAVAFGAAGSLLDSSGSSAVPVVRAQLDQLASACGAILSCPRPGAEAYSALADQVAAAEALVAASESLRRRLPQLDQLVARILEMRAGAAGPGETLSVAVGGDDGARVALGELLPRASLAEGVGSTLLRNPLGGALGLDRLLDGPAHGTVRREFTLTCATPAPAPGVPRLAHRLHTAVLPGELRISAAIATAD